MIAGKLDDILLGREVVHGESGLAAPDAFSQFGDRRTHLNVEVAACDANASNAPSNFKLNWPISPQYLTDERAIWHLSTLPVSESALNLTQVKPLTSIVSGAM